MLDVLQILFLSLLAGAAIPAGALLARFDLVHPSLLSDKVRQFIVAFGGGALLSAVALVLIPDSIDALSPSTIALSFSAGGLVFFAIDKALNRLQSTAGQLIAMLSDFAPEAIALGAAFAVGEETGLVLALMMVLQNLPEGFNAYEEIQSGQRVNPKVALWAFAALAIVGPVCAFTGYYLLSESYALVASIMVFASAGILYLVFQDIAPAARSEDSGFPALGAVAGFLLGLMGDVLIMGV